MYVFDTSALSALFRNYYPTRFPSLWSRFDDLVSSGQIGSVREAFREIENAAIESLRTWADNHKSLFTVPGSEEATFVSKIFAVQHFQQNIEKQKLLKGGLNADPFIIAKAAVNQHVVVTMERFKPTSARIPNICEHFGVRCLTLEQFMEEQGWQF